MIKKILQLSGYFCLALMACSTPNRPPEIAIGLSNALPLPAPNLEFDYLLYDDDYSAVPIDEDAQYYTNEGLDSALIGGMAYQLTNKKAFAPGLFAFVAPETKTTWYHLTIRALKRSTDMRTPLSDRGILVFSWERAGQALHYYSYPIKDLLQQQNKQMVDKWETVEVWQQVPKGIQEGDLLKAYAWNPSGGTIYIDDMVVTAWSVPELPKAIAKAKKRLLAEQSYEHEAPSRNFTKNYAHRGMYSNVVGNLEGYSSFGKTYETSLAAAALEGGALLHLSFAALKQDRMLRNDKGARMVCTIERNGTAIYWESLVINARLWKDGKQCLQEWKTLDWWQELPQDLAPSDILKVYVWNDSGKLIYIDDLLVEAIDQPASVQ